MGPVLQKGLNQSFSFGDDLPVKQSVETFLVVRTWGGSAIDIRVETRDVAPYSVMHKAALLTPSPPAKNDAAPKLFSARLKILG